MRLFAPYRTCAQRALEFLFVGVVIAVAIGCEAVGSQSGLPYQPTAYGLSQSPLVTVGGHDDRVAYQLHYPVGAVRLSDGRLVIADAGPREIRYYDAGGRHEHSIGGSGEGPGEFRNLRSIARIRGDTIVAWDPAARRVSFFAADGDFALGVTLNGWSGVHEQLQAEDPSRTVSPYRLHATGSGGLVLEPFYGRSPAAMEATRVVQDTIPLLAFDRSGEHTAELGRFPAGESFLRNRAGGLLRFGERLSLAAGTDFVYVGSTRSTVVRGISMDGELAEAIVLPMDQRPIAVEDIPPPGTGVTAAHLEAMPVPDYMPVFSQIRYGIDKRLWVQKYLAPNDDSQEWLGFNEAGDLIASLTMDSSMELLDIGVQYALVLVSDEWDVQEVRLYELERLAP